MKKLFLNWLYNRIFPPWDLQEMFRRAYPNAQRDLAKMCQRGLPQLDMEYNNYSGGLLVFKVPLPRINND